MSFGNYISLPASIVADLIDYDEVHTGGRREASYFAIWAFATKFGNAFTGFAALQARFTQPTGTVATPQVVWRVASREPRHYVAEHFACLLGKVKRKNDPKG